MSNHQLKIQAILDTSQVKRQIQDLNSQGAVNLDASGINNSVRKLDDIISKFTSSLDHLKTSVEKTSNQTELNYSRLAKFGIGLATHQLASSATKFFGSESVIGSTVNSLGNIASYTASGAALGPVGAAVGAVVGSISEVFNNLADSSDEAASALKSLANITQQVNVNRSALKEYDLEKEIRLAKENKDVDTLKRLQQSYLTSAESARRYVSENEYEYNKASEKFLEISQFGNFDLYMGKQSNEELDWATKTIEKYKEESKKAVEDLKKADRIQLIINKMIEESVKNYDKEQAEIKKNAERQEKKRILTEEGIQALRKADEELEKSSEIKSIIKSGDKGAISEELSRQEYRSGLIETEYKKALSEQNLINATQLRSDLLKNRGYESTLRSRLVDYDNEIKSLISRLGSINMTQPALASIQTMGGNLGWVDSIDDQINDNVKKIVTRLDELITIQRQTTNSVIL